MHLDYFNTIEHSVSSGDLLESRVALVGSLKGCFLITIKLSRYKLWSSPEIFKGELCVVLGALPEIRLQSATLAEASRSTTAT